jgi:hypothetical protein
MQWLLQIRFGFELVVGEPEIEGMTAVKANVFGPTTAGVVNRNVVTKDHTFHGMSNHLESCLCFNERVPASACVFSCLGVLFDDVNAMTQEPAEVVNFLFKFVEVRIRVGT